MKTSIESAIEEWAQKGASLIEQNYDDARACQGPPLTCMYAFASVARSLNREGSGRSENQQKLDRRIIELLAEKNITPVAVLGHLVDNGKAVLKESRVKSNAGVVAIELMTDMSECLRKVGMPVSALGLSQTVFDATLAAHRRLAGARGIKPVLPR